MTSTRRVSNSKREWAIIIADEQTQKPYPNVDFAFHHAKRDTQMKKRRRREETKSTKNASKLLNLRNASPFSKNIYHIAAVIVGGHGPLIDGHGANEQNK